MFPPRAVRDRAADIRDLLLFATTTPSAGALLRALPPARDIAAQIDEPIARRRPAFRLGDVIKARCLLAMLPARDNAAPAPARAKAPRFAKGPTPACLPQPIPLDSPDGREQRPAR